MREDAPNGPATALEWWWVESERRKNACPLCSGEALIDRLIDAALWASIGARALLSGDWVGSTGVGWVVDGWLPTPLG